MYDEPLKLPLGQVDNPIGRGPLRPIRPLNKLNTRTNGKSIELCIQFSQFTKVHNKSSVSALIEYTVAKLKRVSYSNNLPAIWNFRELTLILVVISPLRTRFFTPPDPKNQWTGQQSNTPDRRRSNFHERLRL